MTISIGLSSGWILSTLFRWNVLAVAAIGLCCSTVTTASEILTQQSPKEVLLRCRDAIDQVSTLKCSAVILAPNDKDSHTDAERDDRGRPVHAFTTYWWDRRGFWRVESRDWQPAGVRHLMGGKNYDHYIYTLNGEFYRGYSMVTNRGKIRAMKRPASAFATPLMFMGYGITDLDENLIRFVMESAVLDANVTSSPEGYLKISGEYDPPNGAYRRQFQITVDPAQDFLPIQIQTRFKWSHTLDQDITVKKTGMVSGIRVPLSGTAAAYAIREIYPDGLTNADVNAMSREKYFAEIEPRIRREAVPVSGPVEFEFPPATLAVNEIYPESFFNLTIPETADVVDYSTSTDTPPSEK